VFAVLAPKVCVIGPMAAYWFGPNKL